MGGKTNRKHNRNRDFCKEYKTSGREVLNKALKQERHQKAQPNDVQKAGDHPVDYTQKKWRNALDLYLLKNNSKKSLTK